MKLKSYIYSFVAGVTMLFSACSPEDYDLGAKDYLPEDLVEGIAYTITHDSNNPNIVYLESQLGTEYTPLWEHPQGRSQAQKVTLKMPFDGTYTVKFGIETRGGIVYGEPTTFTISDFCADFVNDELWTVLSGGVGNSKTWMLDLNAEGQCKYFAGPLYFYGTDDNWNTVTLGEAAPDGADSWNWCADWAGNGSWLFGSTGAMDYGTMTFDLNGGANVVVEDKAAGKTYKGTYMLDTENHTLKLTDAPLLHDPGRDAIVTQWGSITILSMTENTMQLGVVRDNDPSEGPCLLVYNFISKEYSDNWTPTVDTNVAPELQEDWRDYVEPKTNKVITYKLSEETPFDWCNLDGSNKGISLSAASGIEEITLVMNSGTSEYTFTDIEGNEYKGTYTLSAEGIYTFSNGVPAITLSGDGKAVLNAGSDNTLRIMSIETDDYTGGLTDMWLGAKEMDDQGNLYQYMAFHFCPQVAGGTTKQYKGTLNFFDTDWTFINGDPVYISGNGDYTLTVAGSSDSAYGMYLDVEKILKDYPNMDMTIKDIQVDGVSIEFDDSIIDRGLGDAETTARRYILNPWGATADDGPKYSFTSSIAVTITINTDNGVPFGTTAE